MEVSRGELLLKNKVLIQVQAEVRLGVTLRTGAGPSKSVQRSFCFH